jgi:N-acyl-D-amino-acid deacylase
MLDTVIRGATVVDGSGNAPFTGDVGIQGGRIAAVGGKLGAARREIDARGAAGHARLGRRAHPLRRPGHLGPLSFPFHPAWRDHGRHGQLRRGLRARASPSGATWLISVMEGVEDIPGTVLSEGIPGPGRPSRSTWTRWPPNRARWTWAHRCRTAPCAPM